MGGEGRCPHNIGWENIQKAKTRSPYENAKKKKVRSSWQPNMKDG